jgi:hypothetical protein
MRPFVVVLLLLFPVATYSQSASEVAARKALFRYNAAAPVTIDEVSSEQRGDVTVRDITFSPGPGRQVKAYLVAPKRKWTIRGNLVGTLVGRREIGSYSVPR